MVRPNVTQGPRKGADISTAWAVLHPPERIPKVTSVMCGAGDLSLAAAKTAESTAAAAAEETRQEAAGSRRGCSRWS
jgi:hypothetical protein